MITYLWLCHDVVSLQAQAWQTQATQITPNWYPVHCPVSHLPDNIRFNTKWSAGQRSQVTQAWSGPDDAQDQIAPQ